MKVYFKNGTSVKMTQEEVNVIVKDMSNSFAKGQPSASIFIYQNGDVYKYINCSEITHIS